MAAQSTVRSIRNEVKALRCFANDGDPSFIPFESLRKILNRDRIQDVIRDCKDIPAPLSGEAVDWILQGNLKTFAILVLLKDEEHHVLRFIQHDNFQKAASDKKLPLARVAIRHILPEDVADDFFDVQWEFTSLVFCVGAIHRHLDSQVRLPYIKNKELSDEGGFGLVFDIDLHLSYRKLLPVIDIFFSRWSRSADILV